jgi:hypothetical protein
MARRREGIPSVLVLLAILAAVPLFAFVAIPWMQAENAAAEARLAAESAQREAEEDAARRAPFVAAFANPDPLALLAFCKAEVEAVPPWWQPVSALAVQPLRVDAYYRFTDDWRQMERFSCSAAGIERTPVPWPLAGDLRDEGVEAGDPPPIPHGDNWALLQRLISDAGPGALAGVELFVDARRERPLLRWHYRDARPALGEPADAPDFSSLFALPIDLAVEASHGEPATAR